jgi:SNF2 family DNA or RNA helicase
MWRAALALMPKIFSMYELEQGKEFEKSGRVINIRLSDGLLKAQIKDTDNHIYTVFLDLKQWPDDSGKCTCDKRNCRHLAAALLALQPREKNPQENNTSTHTSAVYMREEEINAEEVEWYSEIEESNNHFFNYQLGILVKGKQVNIVPLVIDLIKRWDANTLETLSDNVAVKLPLEGNKFLRITLKRLKPLLRLLYRLSHVKPQTLNIKLKNYQLLQMVEAEQAMLASRARWHGTEVIRKKLSGLTVLEELPQIDLPSGLNAELRDYQKQGFQWLAALRGYQFGAILADDMGLGKTIQTLALLQHEKESQRMNSPTLIIAPTSVVGNWLEEIKRFTPQLKTTTYHGLERKKIQMDSYDIILSTYGVLQRDKKKFLQQTFHYLILDEAQAIKNSRTKTSSIVQQINANHRLCLTGTPMENNLEELWSLFNFLMPGFLGNQKQFRSFFRNPIEKEEDSDKKSLLIHRVQPFLLRRTKQEVVKELPPKTETILRIELAGSQRDLYEAIRLSTEEKVKEAIAKQGLGKSQILLLDALLKLRQVCCDPRLVKLLEAEIAFGNSAKLDALLELLDNLVAEGRKVLVFSQFTSMIALIEIELIKRKFTYLKLTGKSRNRQSIIEAFQKGSYSVFLISLKAGGFGINLTRADTVIHYDPWWNPAVEDQATDRSHRIGQLNSVFVYKLVTSGTVEETVLKLQNRKKKLAEGILSAEKSGNMVLTQDDIDQFFIPLD